VFTATEIAAVAAAYAFVVGLLIYRTLSFAKLPAILLATAKETATILVIAACAAPFGWILGIEEARRKSRPCSRPSPASRGRSCSS